MWWSIVSNVFSENYKQVNAMMALAKETYDTISKFNNGKHGRR